MHGAGKEAFQATLRSPLGYGHGHRPGHGHGHGHRSGSASSFSLGLVRAIPFIFVLNKCHGRHERLIITSPKVQRTCSGPLL